MIRAIALAFVLALAMAASAHAGILAPEDAAELAQSLAEAQDEQGVCYGWEIDNNFSTNDVGSSTGGPDQLLNKSAKACRKGYVVLQGIIDYACDSCESEDSASITIDSNLPSAPTEGDLKGLGLQSGDLTGEKDDTTLVNMVNALPLLVADRGNAPYIEYEPAADVPATDKATDKPGSDFLRDSWILLVLFGALILGAPCFYLYKRAQVSKNAPPPAPKWVPPPTPPPATPAT